MTHPYIRIKVVIADDHEMVREGLQLMISKIDELEVVGEAMNGEHLIAITRTLKPDVIIMDVKMPKYNGVEAAKIIKKEFYQRSLKRIENTLDVRYISKLLQLLSLEVWYKMFITSEIRAKEIL